MLSTTVAASFARRYGTMSLKRRYCTAPPNNPFQQEEPVTAAESLLNAKFDIELLVGSGKISKQEGEQRLAALLKAAPTAALSNGFQMDPQSYHDYGHATFGIHPEVQFKKGKFVASMIASGSKRRFKVIPFPPRALVEGLRNWQGYRRHGVKLDDMHVEWPEVQEALLRLPKHELIARTNRQREAFASLAQKRIMKEDQWTKPEHDSSYLLPYIQEVRAEWQQRNRFRERNLFTTVRKLFGITACSEMPVESIVPKPHNPSL